MGAALKKTKKKEGNKKNYKNNEKGIKNKPNDKGASIEKFKFVQ